MFFGQWRDLREQPDEGRDQMTCGYPASEFRPYASRARWIRTANDSYFTAMTYPEGSARCALGPIRGGLWRRRSSPPPKVTPLWRTRHCRSRARRSACARRTRSCAASRRRCQFCFLRGCRAPRASELVQRARPPAREGLFGRLRNSPVANADPTPRLEATGGANDLPDIPRPGAGGCQRDDGQF
jgi:hypothetical protein